MWIRCQIQILGISIVCVCVCVFSMFTKNRTNIMNKFMYTYYHCIEMEKAPVFPALMKIELRPF